MAIDDVGPSSTDGATDWDGTLVALHGVQRRPDGRLRRPVDVEHGLRSQEERLGQIARQRLTAAEDPEVLASVPAGLDQETEGRRRGLQDGRTDRIAQLAQPRSVDDDVALREVDARPETRGRKSPAPRCRR